MNAVDRNPSDVRPLGESDHGQVVLVLQGGGALGSYQAGVYQALHEAGIEPDWVVGTSIGVIAGSAVPDPAQIGLDFAMPAMFIALAIPLIRSKAEVVVAITSGLAAIGFNAIGFQHWTILAATAVAMIVAFGAIRWKRA